jgi:hypothetical protein
VTVNESETFDELVSFFKARLAGILLPSGQEEACFVALEANLAPLRDSHTLVRTPDGEVGLSPLAPELIAEVQRRLAAVATILAGLGISLDYQRVALRAWHRAHWDRAKDQRPDNLLAHVRLVEEQARSSKGLTPAKRAELIDALHAADAPGIAAHPDVTSATRTRWETRTSSAPDGLAEVFVRLASPDALEALGARPQRPGLSLDAKIEKSKKRAENAERDRGFKLGSGNERRRPLRLTERDLSSPSSPDRDGRLAPPDKAEVEKLLATMTREQRSAVLGFLDTKSATRTGERLGKSPQAIENLLTAARERVRKLGFDLNLKRI